MTGEGSSAGTATPSGGPSKIREIVDQALLLSRAPGSLEPTSGGVVPSRLLGDFVTAGLESLYEATGTGTSLEQWLAAAFEADLNQLRVSVPLALARLLDASATVPRPEFHIPPMSQLEDEMDAGNALLAMEEYAQIPDNLPPGLGLP